MKFWYSNLRTKIFKKMKLNCRLSDVSYLSNYSDRNLHDLGFCRAPGSLVDDSESLWDFRHPVSLRMRKIKKNDNGPSVIGQPKKLDNRLQNILTTGLHELSDTTSDAQVHSNKLLKNSDAAQIVLGKLKSTKSVTRKSTVDKSQQANLNMPKQVMQVIIKISAIHIIYPYLYEYIYIHTHSGIRLMGTTVL